MPRLQGCIYSTTVAWSRLLKPNPLTTCTEHLPLNPDQAWSKGTGCPGGDSGREGLQMGQRKASRTAHASVGRACWNHPSVQNQAWVWACVPKAAQTKPRSALFHHPSIESGVFSFRCSSSSFESALKGFNSAQSMCRWGCLSRFSMFP